jgi:hypothetical protein
MTNCSATLLTNVQFRNPIKVSPAIKKDALQFSTSFNRATSMRLLGPYGKDNFDLERNVKADK